MRPGTRVKSGRQACILDEMSESGSSAGDDFDSRNPEIGGTRSSRTRLQSGSAHLTLPCHHGSTTMALVSGDRLGPYEVEHLLGAGGMGEVYRGVDTRLGRAVALKVISLRLVGDEASRRRFETEARAASALNHPAIVTIYDIGESDGMSWIAMELVEGRTLRDTIAPGPMSIRQAWSIARQFAEGLAAAHAKGIVHRDLKPENVMLTPEGAGNILDFGVARQVVAATPAGATPVATVTDAGTVAGTILGTVGYMSPEQATGRNADFNPTSSRSAPSSTSCSPARAPSIVRPRSKRSLPFCVTSRFLSSRFVATSPTYFNECSVECWRRCRSSASRRRASSRLRSTR